MRNCWTCQYLDTEAMWSLYVCAELEHRKMARRWRLHFFHHDAMPPLQTPPCPGWAKKEDVDSA